MKAKSLQIWILNCHRKTLFDTIMACIKSNEFDLGFYK